MIKTVYCCDYAGVEKKCHGSKNIMQKVTADRLAAVASNW